MIVTVTANTTIDQTLFISSFERNRTIRANYTVQSMGGKPTDASWILGELGIASLALGFAAGAMGNRVMDLLHARGVQTDFVQVDGETRINTVIVAQDEGWQSTITTNTLRAQARHIEQLREKYLAALENASCVVLGGTLPAGVEPDFYTEWIALARARELPVIFDADEPNLSAGLKSAPTFIKPNVDELEALTGEPIPDFEAAYQAGRRIIEKYGSFPIITLGKKGGLAVLQDRAYYIPALEMDIVSASGAGDGVLAGLAAALHFNQPIEEGLRQGFANAAAICLMPGTADCRREDVERLLPQIELIPFP